jgi:RNA polymerase sigma-70 factor (ECF subfamily)
LERSDLELVRAAVGGDERSFHVLVDRHSPALFRVARSLSRNRADAEDLLQETLVSAFRGLKRFEARSSLKTWLLRILTRKAATAWHRSRRVRKTLSIHAPDDQRVPEPTVAAAMVADGASTARSVEQRIDVMETLGRMPEPYREVLVLREVRQLSYEEIAQVLGVPRGTVESRLFRARADFRRRFAGGGETQL